MVHEAGCGREKNASGSTGKLWLHPKTHNRMDEDRLVKIYHLMKQGPYYLSKSDTIGVA